MIRLIKLSILFLFLYACGQDNPAKRIVQLENKLCQIESKPITTFNIGDILYLNSTKDEVILTENVWAKKDKKAWKFNKRMFCVIELDSGLTLNCDHRKELLEWINKIGYRSQRCS